MLFFLSLAVLIDASTAFRVDPDWTYGFPELNKGQKAAVQSAQRISNPGCYPTGFISLVGLSMYCSAD